MKKLLSLLFIVLILLLIFWGGATWFLGQETEKQFKAFSEAATSNSKNLNRTANTFEISDYKNTSFLDAQAIVRLTSSMPLLDNLLSNTNIITTIQHGPLIVDTSGLTFAASKLSAQVDVASLDEETRATLTQLFGNKAPIEAEIIIDFSDQAHYRISIPTLSQEGVSNLDIDGLTLTGTHSLKTYQGTAQLNVGEVHMQDSSLEVIMPTLSATMNIEGFAGSQMLGSSQIEAKNIKLKPMDSDDILFDVRGDTLSQQNDKELVGKLSVNVENIKESSGQVKHIAYVMDYQGLSIAGLDEFSVVEQKLENLQNQLSWNMEATENPEGQEKMLALIEQMQQASQEMLQVFFNKVLIAKKSQLQQTLAISSDTVQSTLKSDVVYTGLENQQAINTDQLLLGDVTGILKTIAGTLSIQLNKAMLPEVALAPLNMLVTQGIASNAKENFSLNASLTDGKITLNGKTFTFEEFIAKFSGEATATLEGEAAAYNLPEDMQKRLQEEGLSPEVMQTLEESEDIDPEVLKVLQEVYKENSQIVDDVSTEVPAELPSETAATPSQPTQ
jgi:hypothetical protein